MSRVQYRVICPNPNHKESTPSCAVYEDGSGYCFGCSTYFKDLGKNVSTQAPIVEKEDLQKSLEYIDSLPKMEHRGLVFPYDNRGYYLVWPTRDYYKLRRWTGNPKYMGAKGHAKPWFHIKNKSKKLILVEGEINALSLHEADKSIEIISPGGVGNFFDKSMQVALPFFKQYDEINIIVDNDDVGINAALKCKQLINSYCLDVRIILAEEDCNEILVKHGTDKLKEKFIN